MSLQKKTLRYLATEIIIALWNWKFFKISKVLPPLWQTRRNKFFHHHRLQTSPKQQKRQQKLYASFTMIFIEFRSSIPEYEVKYEVTSFQNHGCLTASYELTGFSLSFLQES